MEYLGQSRPAWARGLKLRLDVELDAAWSRPAWARGLKRLRLVINVHSIRRRAPRGRVD